MKPGLDRETIIGALQRLSELLRERGIQGEICLFGGTAMVLAFNARVRTKDVDAIFTPPQIIRELASAVQEELYLPDGWLNDGVKGFLAPGLDPVAYDLPQFDYLRVTAPPPEYLLAMKCMAARIASGTDTGGDVDDIRFLIRRLNLTSAGEAMAIVAADYQQGRVPPGRGRCCLEPLCERRPAGMDARDRPGTGTPLVRPRWGCAARDPDPREPGRVSRAQHLRQRERPYTDLDRTMINCQGIDECSS